MARKWLSLNVVCYLRYPKRINDLYEKHVITFGGLGLFLTLCLTFAERDSILTPALRFDNPL